MIQLLKFYWENSIKLQGGFGWLIKHVLLYPIILVLLYFGFKHFSFGIDWMSLNSSKDLVNTLAIVSGFLLTGLSIILANTKISESKKDEIEDKFKSYIHTYGDGDINKWLSKFKLSLLLDTIFLIGVCVILALVVTIFNINKITIIALLYLFGFLCFNLLSLIKQILTYLHIVEFNQ